MRDEGSGREQIVETDHSIAPQYNAKGPTRYESAYALTKGSVVEQNHEREASPIHAASLYRISCKGRVTRYKKSESACSMPY